MKQLAKILASLAIIIITVVAADILLGKLADHQFMDKPGARQHYELTSLRDVDILIVGSSRSRRHYDTPYISEQLNRRAYNVGYDGMGITFHTAMIKSILDETVPRILILEGLPNDLSGEYNDRIKNLYPYIALNHNILDVAAEVDPVNRYTLRSNLIRYNSSLLDLWDCKNDPYDPSTLGFGRDDSKGPEDFEEVVYPTPQNVDPVASRCLEQISEICKSRGIDLIVTISPEYFVRKDPCPVGLFCAEHDIKFIDNSKLRFDSLDIREYFLDYVHMNSTGARLYTQQFLKQLSEISDTSCRDIFLPK